MTEAQSISWKLMAGWKIL